MAPAPHLFIGTFDTTPARQALATGIARHLHLAVSAAGATVFRPLPGEPVPEDPRTWGAGMPGVRGLVSYPEGFPPEDADLVIAIRLRGGRATAQLEIYVISPFGELLSRHFGTGAAPSLMACIASALASINELGDLGIPDPFTRPELITAMTDAHTPKEALRNLEKHGEHAVAMAEATRPRELDQGILIPNAKAA